jgi:ferredoxin
LKSKKSLITDCPYENYIYKKKGEKGGDVKSVQTIKCIAKSHPYFQEFRLWQFVKNLKIYQREKEVDGKLCTDVDVTNDFINCDYFFNLAKLKTHGFAYYTGCVKNLFGLIYGLNKASYHLKFNNIDIFSDCICDLYNTFNKNCKAKKIIHVIDGILGLEGEGPGAKGVSKKANALIMGLDPFSVDIVAMNVVSLDYKKSYIHLKGESRNLGNCSLENINIIGNRINDFNVKFEEPDTVKGIGAIKFIEKVNLKRFFFECPKFNNLCVRCRECIKICPAKALSIKNNKVVVDKEKCIRCWCCQEVCPYKAIDKSKRPILGRIFFR